MAEVACPDGQSIAAVEFGSYGLPTGECGAFGIGDCHAENSAVKVGEACLGAASCKVVANNDTFGDPCEGTVKKLYLQVLCK